MLYSVFFCFKHYFVNSYNNVHKGSVLGIYMRCIRKIRTLNVDNFNNVNNRSALGKLIGSSLGKLERALGNFTIWECIRKMREEQ